MSKWRASETPKSLKGQTMAKTASSFCLDDGQKFRHYHRAKTAIKNDQNDSGSLWQ